MLRHTQCPVLGHTPKDQRRQWHCCSQVSCVKSLNLCKEQHMIPSPAQHALGLTFRVATLLQATSPAIPSPLAGGH